MRSVGTAQGLLAGHQCWGPVPGTTSPALPWHGALAQGHSLPWAGSWLLTPRLLFLVKNSPEARCRGRGAEVFALRQHAAQRGQVMVAAQGGERDIAALLCLTQARQRVRTEQEESKRKIRRFAHPLAACTPLSHQHRYSSPSKQSQGTPGAPQAPRVVPRLLAPPGNRLVI